MRANVPVLAPTCSWDCTHTSRASWTKEELQAGQEPEALDIGWCCVRWPCRGVWLFTCCTHFLQQFSFSLISCVFLRNLAKSVLILLCFILRSKGGNHLHLIFGGRKSLQPLLWPTPPVFLSSSTYCQCVTGWWVCGVFPVPNHRKMRSKVSPWEGRSIPGHPISWELEQYNPHWGVTSTAGKMNGLCWGFSNDRTAIHYFSMLPLLWMILCLKQLI